MNDSLRSYYASRRASAIVNCNGSDREIGMLLVIDGENKKEHKYLIRVYSN